MNRFADRIRIGGRGLHLLRVVAVIAVLAPGWGCGAFAAASAPVTTARTTARLLSDADTVGPGRVIHVGLELTPALGWHTYWHNPGEAGAAPDMGLAVSGATLGGMAWPVPRRFVDHGVVSFGYDHAVLLVRSLSLERAGPLTVSAHAHWVVCKDICVPEDAVLRIDLAAGPAGAAAEQPAFAAAARQVPVAWTAPARITPDGALVLSGTAGVGEPTMFFPDSSDGLVLGAAPDVWRHGGDLAVRLRTTRAFRADRPLTGVLAMRGDPVGYRVFAEPGPYPADLATRQGWSPWLLLLALGGGLLLNAMPCVFPVLAIKAMAWGALSRAAPNIVRAQALAYVAGVLASFTILGGVFLSLRAAGSTVGWGFQFQWPAFVAVMAWLFFAIGLNLSGVFTVGGRWAGVGQALVDRGGTAGSFATGLLAVLVATPCTAPFMGAAVAAAAIAPIGLAMALFLALGVGFSLPWLLLGLRPTLAARLPAPGRWMEHLRQGLAFPMYASAIWMLWVQAVQTGPAGVAAVGAGWVLIGLAVWAHGISGTVRGTTRGIARIVALGCIAASLAMLPQLARAPLPTTAVRAETFSVAKLEALRRAGQPVLVNMSAAWCVTCLINERVAIRLARPVLAAHRVAYMTGDWTRQDDAITGFLRQYGRDGVPLYVFFPAGAAQGRVLPQILTARLLEGLVR